ncbi:MAG: type II toxin-antitoxin system RelE/ParE family toxin [Prevotellaceae bacterium]|jgi:plasmid stabilization system protein ParE|nr:type II toxin-antitoxin system RelE/ParE family toxin [Prevotellaceae bacterium]
MVINWSDTAKARLREIFYYYENEVSNKKALEIVTKITSSVTPLENFPEQAALEPLLIERTKDYRSLVVMKIFKVVYYIENEVVNISEIWDCRQAPETNIKKIKE